MHAYTIASTVHPLLKVEEVLFLQKEETLRAFPLRWKKYRIEVSERVRRAASPPMRSHSHLLRDLVTRNKAYQLILGCAYSHPLPSTYCPEGRTARKKVSFQVQNRMTFTVARLFP